MRESKRRTSWMQANDKYESAMLNYSRRALEDTAIRKQLEEFLQLLLPAAYVASLGQTLFKLTAYGIPDIYQGTELWDTSLVDPDNRRAVDFGQLQQQLERVSRCSTKDVLQDWASGLPKLFVLQRVLGVRRDNPGLFGEGAHYKPLTLTGDRAAQVIAYARGEDVIAVAPLRFFATSDADGVTALSSTDFAGTRLGLSGTFRNLFSPDQRLTGEVDLAELFDAFPVALLMRT
jgi:(1->4)-alpha-D-glucan 1-alpha-D-glucosylmutase